MPKINSQDIYKAAYAATLAVLAEGTNRRSITQAVKPGASVYRYVSYREGPQPAGGARTQWVSLEGDLSNRWTGSDGQGGGKQGLYCTVDPEGQETARFVELEYYHRKAKIDPRQATVLAEPKTGKGQRLTSGMGEFPDQGALHPRTVVLFFTNKELSTANVSMNTDSGRAFLEKVFQAAKQANPKAFSGYPDLIAAHNASEDASFDRAVGNALLAKGFDAFKTASVRQTADKPSENFVIGAAHQAELSDTLKAGGRITYYMTPQGQTKVCYTMDDLRYNSEIEPETAPEGSGAEFV